MKLSKTDVLRFYKRSLLGLRQDLQDAKELVSYLEKKVIVFEEIIENLKKEQQ